jgi:flagellar basal-body rod protein FlgG
MNPGLRTSASGMLAQQLRVDTIAHNLANVNTTAFKRSRVAFEDVMYQTIQGTRIVNDQATATVPQMQVGRGVRPAGILRVATQGPIETTGRPLDLAIEGEGFFQVLQRDGSIGYTRDGSLTVSDTGALVTTNGYGLVPGIAVPAEATDISVSPSGVVSATLGATGEVSELGRIELARFLNPTGLMSLGENLYARTAASGDPMTGQPQETGFGRLVQGGLESSNVEIVQEMVDMISAQRAYEVNAKAITTAEAMIEQASALIR